MNEFIYKCKCKENNLKNQEAVFWNICVKKVYVNKLESRVIKESKNNHITALEPFNVTQFGCLFFLELECMCYF